MEDVAIRKIPMMITSSSGNIYSYQIKKMRSISGMYKRPEQRLRLGTTTPILTGFPAHHYFVPFTEPKPRRTVPILDLDGYLWGLKRNGASQEEIDAAHKRNFSPLLHMKRDFNAMRVLTYIKGSTVRVRIEVPFAEAYPYYKAGRVPPIEVQLRCLKRFGFTAENCAHVIWKHQHSKPKSVFLDDVFDFCLYKAAKKRPYVGCVFKHNP
jgi:hypothetical protein